MAGASVDTSPNLGVSAIENWHREVKRPRRWYFRLESESSVPSEEDTESVYSIQDKETDVARDTSDTDTKSESEDSIEIDIEVEYEVASSSDNEDNGYVDSSSETEDIMIENAIAAAICDVSLEAWATDNEMSDTGSLEDLGIDTLKFLKCIQCRSENDHPHFRYCEKCYQVRKMNFPPRPRGRKRGNKNQKKDVVQVDTLSSCLKGLSQDSGLCSSQELPSLDFEQIIVPDHVASSTVQSSEKSKTMFKRKRSDYESEDSLEPSSSSKSESPAIKIRQELPSIDLEKMLAPDNIDCNRVSSSSIDKRCTLKRKHSDEESEDTLDSPSSSVRNENPLAKKCKTSNEDLVKDVQEIIKCNEGSSLLESKELCIICNVEPKNSVFLHSRLGHMCCCYKCARRIYLTNKRCPVCNCKVSNVIKVFVS